MNKVSKGQQGGTLFNPSGSVVVDIAGANRAYGDITIRPTKAKFLTIPLHSMAVGKTASQIPNLFKPKDKNILATVQNGKLVAVFALAKRAFQPKDSSLMPSDETFSKNICERWYTKFIDEVIHE